MKVVHGAKMKDQAKEDYFYGKDEIVENALADFENNMAHFFREIIRDKSLPKYGSEIYVAVFIYILFVKFRTKKAGKQTNSFTDASIQNLMKHDKDMEKYVGEIFFAYDNAASFSLGIAAHQAYEILDLKMKLIVNESGTDFVLSDHPVVAYNIYSERKKHPGGTTGMGSRGIIYFLPLSPKETIILYDLWAYRVGNQKQNMITIDSPKDAKYMNVLQCINSDEVVFFKDMNSGHQVLAAMKEAKTHPEFEQVMVKNYPQPHRSTIDEESILVHQYLTPIEIGLDLSFMKLTKKARKYDLGDRINHSRNPRHN